MEERRSWVRQNRKSINQLKRRMRIPVGAGKRRKVIRAISQPIFLPTSKTLCRVLWQLMGSLLQPDKTVLMLMMLAILSHNIQNSQKGKRWSRQALRSTRRSGVWYQPHTVTDQIPADVGCVTSSQCSRGKNGSE